jgi:hypothetical protein
MVEVGLADIWQSLIEGALGTNGLDGQREFRARNAEFDILFCVSAMDFFWPFSSSFVERT